MKAMIFAAGLGTRLRPLTNDKPKALVKVAGKPMLEHVINKLVNSGFNDLIINVHHFADKVEDFLLRNHNFNIQITISDERDEVLETGGGLKKASHFFNDGQPFLVCNTDVLTNLDLGRLYEAHIRTGAMATLAVRQRQTSRYLLFNEQRDLCGWKNIKTGKLRPPTLSQDGLSPLAFSGIQILDPTIFPLMKHEGKFSIIETYLDLMEIQTIKAFRHDAGIWVDLGKKENIKEAEERWAEFDNNSFP